MSLSTNDPPMEVLVARSSHDDSSGIPNGGWWWVVATTTCSILVMGLVVGSSAGSGWYETVVPSSLFVYLVDGPERIAGVMTAWLLMVIIMVAVVRRKGQRRVRVDEVRIMPGLGVQLSHFVASSVTLRAASDSLFIPRQDIQNVLLTEVVSSYQVITVLVLVLSNKQTSSSTSSFLQPVFPNVQLTYRESERMWYELRKALDLPIE